MSNELDIWVIITEHDTDDPLRSEGALIGEQYTKSSSLHNIIERGEQLEKSGRYGRVWIAKLERPISVETARALHDRKLPF